MTEVPQYMNEGSTGHVATILQIFLFGVGAGSGLIFDNQYGPATAKAMALYQRSRGVSADGNCGPETRQAMKSHTGFDFDAACRAVRIQGVPSRFIQPDGTIIEY